MSRIIVGTSAALLLVALPLAAEPPKPPVAATVNGEEIPLAQVDAFIRTKLAIIPVTDAQLKQLRTEVLAGFIDDLVLKQFLTKSAPKVEAAEIDKQLAAFADSLARKGSSLAQFLKESRQTEAELRESWTLTHQLDLYMRQTVTEALLKQYYDANKDYFDRVEVKASHILVRVGPKALPMERAAAKERLLAIQRDVAAGKLDFAAAARKHSQCPSAAKGGDLGWLPRKGSPMDDAFCKAAFALKPGQLSDPIETDFGLHLILIAERKPGTPSQFDKCLDEVRESYTDDHRAELIAKARKDAQVRIMLP